MKKWTLTMLFVGMAVLSPGSGHATGCQDCYSGPGFTDRNNETWTEAQCCLSDSCPFENDPEWSIEILESTYCRVDWVTETGWVCQGDSFSCDSGGGGAGSGGGGSTGSCTVGSGSLCPAECSSCERDPFRV